MRKRSRDQDDIAGAASEDPVREVDVAVLCVLDGSVHASSLLMREEARDSTRYSRQGTRETEIDLPSPRAFDGRALR